VLHCVLHGVLQCNAVCGAVCLLECVCAMCFAVRLLECVCAMSFAVYRMSFAIYRMSFAVYRISLQPTVWQSVWQCGHLVACGCSVAQLAATPTPLCVTRAMVDDVLPPAFISLVPPRVAAASERVRQVLAQVCVGCQKICFICYCMVWCVSWHTLLWRVAPCLPAHTPIRRCKSRCLQDI